MGRTTQEIDQKLGELETKRRRCVEQAETLEAKATEETLETGTSETAEAAFRLRVQLPAIDRAIGALQNERVEALERERAERERQIWDGTIRPGARKLLARIESVVGFLDIVASELSAIRREGFDLVNRAPRLRRDFERTMLHGTLSNLCHLRLRDHEMMPPPLQMASPETMVKEFVAMLLYLAPPEADEPKAETETSSAGATGSE